MTPRGWKANAGPKWPQDKIEAPDMADTCRPATDEQIVQIERLMPLQDLAVNPHPSHLIIDAMPALLTRIRSDTAEIAHLRAALTSAHEALGWVDAWISNPVGNYSVVALDGLFAATRARIHPLLSVGERS